MKQAEKLTSLKRRLEVDRLNGQWARWSIDLIVKGLMVDRLDG